MPTVSITTILDLTIYRCSRTQVTRNDVCKAIKSFVKIDYRKFRGVIRLEMVKVMKELDCPADYPFLGMKFSRCDCHPRCAVDAL